MIPFANTTVTVYHLTKERNAVGKTQSRWERSVYEKCHIIKKNGISSADGMLVATRDTIIQIEGDANIKAGDILVIGICKTEIPLNGVPSAILSDTMSVLNVDYNAGPLPHTAIKVI